ncbi:papain-like cysteine protease family protein [Burkholderia sp. AW49-1]
MSRANVRLNVPLVGQQTASDGTPLMVDKKDGRGLQPHGHLACWHAAACMVLYGPDKEGRILAGPRRLAMPKIWLKDEGLNPSMAPKFAKAARLTVLERPTTVTAEWLARTLSNYGAIWAGGAFQYGSAHSIVITGVQDDTVFYNDPWEPRAKIMTVDDLQARLGVYPGCLLVKDRRFY